MFLAAASVWNSTESVTRWLGVETRSVCTSFIKPVFNHGCNVMMTVPTVDSRYWQTIMRTTCGGTLQQRASCIFREHCGADTAEQAMMSDPPEPIRRVLSSPGDEATLQLTPSSTKLSARIAFRRVVSAGPGSPLRTLRQRQLRVNHPDIDDVPSEVPEQDCPRQT